MTVRACSYARQNPAYRLHAWFGNRPLTVRTVGGRPHFLTTEMRILLPLTLLAMLNWACATAPSIPPQQPTGLPSADVPRVQVKLLGVTPGITVYQFSQSADIRPESALDTVYSTITTEALFSVAIVPQSDSMYEVTVIVDSVRITTGGSAPLRRQQIEGGMPISLGPVLRTSLGTRTGNVEHLLPDSLCAYGQVTGAARELILLPLPHPIRLSEGARWSDSSRFSTCRAGAAIETGVFLEATYLGSQRPNQLALRTLATVKGAGIIRTDSVTISGTITSTGTAYLEGANRLPTLLQTESRGTISIRLGDSTAVFRQHSRQEWRQRSPN